MVKNGESDPPDPPEKDMKDFEFIQLCKFRVSEANNEISLNRSQLLAASSLYGLLFFATNDKGPGFKVVKTSELVAIDQSKDKERNKVTVIDFPVEAEVTLPGPIEFLSLSSDDLTLAVVLRDAGQLNILYFDVRSLSNKPSSVMPFTKSTFNVPNVSVVDIGWNPAQESMLAVCLSDGSMQMLEITVGTKVLASLPASVGASCFSWSPKGKQLLIGKKDGTLTQYEPGLKEKKHWACPAIFSAPQTVVDVVWVSTYSFFASYLAVGAQASEQPIIVQTLSNKENNTKYINHEDPCFSNGEDVKPHFLFNFILKWDMVIMASSRASEATVIGKSLDDKVSWEHWNLDDCSRAELPLTASQNDSFPVGMAIDFSPQSKVVLTLPGGGSKVLPPCPILFLLTNDGILLSYHLSYTHKDAVEVTTIPQVLDTSSARIGVQGPAIQATPQGAMSSLTTPSAIQPAAPSNPASLAAPFAAFSTPTTTVKPFPFGGAGTTSVGGFFAPGQKPPPPFGSSPSPFQTTQQTSSPFQTTQQTSSPFQSSQLSLSTPSSTAPAWSFSGTAPAAAVSKGQSSAFVSLNQPSMTTASGFSFDQSTLPRPSLSSTMQTKPPTVPALGAGGQPPAGSQLPTPAAGSMKTMGLFGSKSVQAQSEGVVTAAQPNQSVPGTTTFFSRPTQQTVRPPAPASMAPVAQHTPPASANMPAAFMGKQGMVAPPSYSTQPTDKGAPPQINKDARTPGGSIPVEESKSAIKARVDIAFTHNIAEEIADFNLEISKLKSRNKQGGKPVGNRAEIATLRQDAEIMSNFLEEIKEATKDQTKECKDSKSACYNLLCMAEECNTLHQRNNDPHYHSLLQGRALDPVSAEKLKSLQQLAQSIEATVIDVDHVLDSQWADHLSKEKGRMTTSAGDTIYKSIKNNHWLIGDQRVRLEKLEEQIRSLKLRPKAKKFENENPFERMSQAKRTPETKGSPSANSTMTPEKVSRLKDYLLQRKVPVVKSTTPSDLSMSRIAMQSAKKTASSARANVVSTPQLEANHSSTPQTRPSPANANRQLQQTPTGIPASQLRLPRGTLPDMSNLPAPQKPSIPFVSGISQPSPPQPAGPVAASGGASPGVGYGQPRGSPQIPTAFSGVAYFRPPQHHQPQAQAQAQPRPLVPAMGQGIPMGAQIPPEVQAAAQVLSKHMGSSMVPGGPLAHIPQLLSGGGVDKSSLKQPLKMEHFYEDITPTETDETNDDDEDDDYDEEDNGYEDEDEDEEEVAGQKSVFGQQLNVKPGGLSTHVQSVVKVASPPGSADATQDKKPPVFAPPKLSSGGPAPSFNFGQSSPTSSSGAAPSSTTTTTASSFFGGGAAIKPAFSFGGGGLFGQKASVGSGAGSIPVFGSVATPSKGVGFGELATGSGKPSETDASPSGVQSKAGFTTSLSSGDNAPKDAPVFGKSKDAAATSSAPSSADVATKPTSSSVSVSTPPMTAFSFVSPSADASKPIADSTVGSMIGAQSKTSTKPDEIVKTSPFANQTAGTGFSIFGGNKAASPEGSKAGFDAVFSATSPNAATSSATSGFSFAPNANNLSSPFGGSSNVFGDQSKVSETVAKITDSGVNASGGSAANQISSGSSATSQEKPPTSTVTTTSTSFLAKGEMPTPTNLFSSSSLAAGSSPVTSTSGTSGTLTQATSSAAANTTSSGFTFGNFGSATTATTTSSSLFGSLSLGSSTAPATTETATLTSTSTSVPSLFGGSSSAQATPPATTASTTTTGFGALAAATSSTTTGFGALTAATTATTTTTSQASTIPVFGGGGGSSVGFSGPITPGSLFGSATVSSASSTVSGTTTPLFGDGSAVTAGSPAISSTTQVPAATSAAPSLFSGSSSSFGSAPAFGTPTTSTTSDGSLFGGAAATTAATSSIFGNGGTTSASSPFGFGTVSKPSGGLFGSTNTATTSAGNGGPFSAPSGGGLFGNSSTTGSLFGASSAQGVSSSQTGSVFGQPEQTAGSMPFGQSQAGTGSLFGSGSGGFGLGGKPSEEKAKQNVFGSSSHTFGASNTESSSLFGSGGSSSFGTVGMAGSTFDNNNAGGGGNGVFSSNRGTGVSATGFGVAASTNPSGFGSAPSFGANPSFSSPGFGSGFGGGNTNTGFGASPSFGVGASFGSSPAFAKSPGFGSTPSADSGGGFGNFASTSAPTFGQLASSPGSSFGANKGSGGFGGGGQAMPSIFGSGGGDNNNAGGGGFGSFGASPGFGQAAQAAPAFGAAPSSGFGGSSFGSSPAFSSYRG